MLFSLITLPILAWMYARGIARRHTLAAKFSALGLETAVTGSNSNVHRYLPSLLFFSALALLLFSLARPQMRVTLPRIGGTVVLAFDVSGSMAATDIPPTRLEAAKAAAKAFVEAQPAAVQIGVVTFAEGGIASQTPTYDRPSVLAAINRLQPNRGTSLANGIAVALKSIADAETADETDYYYREPKAPPADGSGIPEGKFDSAAIVLITDGENTIAPDPMEAVKLATDRGVRIHTVGVGSPQGVQVKLEGFSVVTRLDEQTLQAVSAASGGDYFNAANVDDMRTIYDTLGSRLTQRSEDTELTALLAAIGTVLLLIGAGLSMLWLGRAL
jgi:Ca-activated chloride channel family protein